MSKLFLIAFLAIFIHFECFDALPEFGHLCGDRVLIEKDRHLMINSFYRIKFERELEPLSLYWSRQDNLLNFGELLREIYFKEFSRSSLCSNSLIQEKSPEDITYTLARRKVVDENSLIVLFKSLCAHFLTAEVLSPEQLKLRLDDLNTELLSNPSYFVSNLSSTFKDYPIDIFYQKRIVSLDNIIIQRKQRLYQDFLSTAIVQYSIYIPFYDQEPFNQANCTSVVHLPNFFVEDIKLVEPKFLSNSQIDLEFIEHLRNKEFKKFVPKLSESNVQIKQQSIFDPID